MQSPLDFFEQTNAYHVLVVGDLMLDRYVMGSVDRISPEAPVPVLRWKRTESRLGGAANVAINLKGLGARVSLAGMVGDDRDGQLIKELLDEQGIGHSLVLMNPHAITTVKTRILGGHQHLLRIDEEEYQALNEVQVGQFMDQLETAWREAAPDIVILQDYNKGFLSGTQIDALMAFMQERGVPVCVDPKSDHFFGFKGAAIFKPNLRELRAQVPFQVGVDKAGLDQAAAYLRDRLGCELAVITLSEHGVYIGGRNGSGIYPTRPRNVVDVCGAGDAVIAVLALAYLMDADAMQMAELSNTAGGLVCSEVGVCPVNRAKMEAEIRGHAGEA